MPPNPKLYLNGRVHFVSTRTQQGLPFVAAEHMLLILEGILARATEEFDVTLCHYLWMANHLHMIVVVHDPEQMSGFIRYIKTESAHAVNRLLGRRNHTVWSEGSDAPVLLTHEDVVREIAYIYANPAKADLTDTIEDYPMLSSWGMFRSRQNTRLCPVVTRDQIPRIGSEHLSLRQQSGFSHTLEKGTSYKAKLRISPYAWMECFRELEGTSRKDVDCEVLRQLHELESEARAVRKRDVRGALALQTADMDTSYQPKKFGRKMICICRDKEKRIEFIAWAKSLFKEARSVFQAWKRGLTHLRYPPGMFAPSLPRAANLLI